MKSRYRYLSFLSFFILIFLPASAAIENSSKYYSPYNGGYANGYYTEFNNTTGENGENISQDPSYYFNSVSGSSCIETGVVKGYGKEIPVHGLVDNVTFLTNTPESEVFPVWTADGNYILYSVEGNSSGISESCRMKADGSKKEIIDIGKENLTGFSDVSPSGKEVLLTKFNNFRSGLYIANLFTEKITAVTDDPNSSESWGAWCRFGDKLVYTQESAGAPSQLWMVNRDGIGRSRLGNSENIGIGKDWCPLGQKIIYSARDSNSKDELWVIDRDSTNQTQLTNTSYGEWNPTFSPDGKKIVYVADESGKPEIWIRDINGNYKARLTDNLGLMDSNPKWSPDGLEIVFAARNLQNVQAENTTGTIVNYSEVNGSDIAVIKFHPGLL